MSENCFGAKGQVSFEFILTVIMVLLVLGFGLYIFEDRSILNSTSLQQWDAKETAYRIARNVNNSYFLDGNATFSDYIYWFEDNKRVEFGKNVVMVLWDNNSFADAFISAPSVDVRVTDFNGEIIFEKIDQAEFNEVNELQESERGEGGYGHTGI